MPKFKKEISFEIRYNNDDEKTRRIAEQLDKLVIFMLDYWDCEWWWHTNVNCK